MKPQRHSHDVARRCLHMLSGVLSVVLALVPFASGAATITKAAAGTDLTNGESQGGTAPGSGDVAAWLSTSLGAGLTLGTSPSSGGISLTNALSP